MPSCTAQRPLENKNQPSTALFSRKLGRGDGLFQNIPAEAGEASDLGVCELGSAWERARFWLSGVSAEPGSWATALGLSAGKASHHSELCSANSAVLVCFKSQDKHSTRKEF